MIENLDFSTIDNIAVSSLKTNYIRIENRDQYLFKCKKINPINEIEYLNYWRRIKKMIVEGIWGTESGGYRYAPGSLIFYGNLCLIQDTNENKQTYFIKPTISDLEWEIFYGLLEAEGFSGFSEDKEYTSDQLVLTYDKNKLPQSHREFQLFRPDGKLKTYITARENIRKLHSKKLGVPYYYNVAKNYSILGSRGGGKSYSISLGKLLHAIVVDGGRYYSDQTGLFYEFPTYAEEHALIDKKKPTVEVMAGSGDTDKSSEFISKIVASMNALAVEEEFGVWGEPGDDDYTPCPLFKDMSGSVAPGNKKRPWQHKYKVIQNGREIFEGSESKLYHPTYSAQKAKGKGSQAGAGGRVAYSAIEESGLTENTIEIHNSNTNVVSRNGVQFGVQIDLGTSGNIVAIVQTKKKFLNPQDYNIVEYDDEWEGMGKRGKIGFFLPAYMTLRQYKDNNGNTDFVAALKHIKHLRDEAAKSDDPSVLREERMNRPIVPSEMWITAKGYYLPYDESVGREKDLMKNKLYYSLMTPVKLSWNTKYSNGVEYKIDYEAEPFIEWPINTNRSNLDGSVIIYDFPKDSIPNDFYFFTHDTYVSENIDQGGSLGVTHGWISPKYWDEYMPVTGPMVCTYIGKPLGGLKEHYNTQEMLIQMYGNPTGGLAFEANRGADCKNHYVNKGKAHLLMPRPINTEGMSMYAKRVQEYGIVVGNKISKINFLDKTYDWLVQPINVGGIKKLVIETIPCLFTVRQMIGYDIDGNFDAVSSLILAPKYIQELEAKLIKEKQQQAHNPLTFLSQNGGIFKNPDPNKSLQRKMEQYSEINPIFEN